MQYPLTNSFKRIKEEIDSPNITNKIINCHFLNYEEEKRVKSRIKRYERVGYLNVIERYIDVINIDNFYFYAELKLNEYFSKLEFSIENLYSGLRLLENDYDSKLWYDGQSEEEIALWKTFRVFDTRPEIGDGKMAVFSIKEGEAPPNEPEIYFIDRETAYKTNLTFVQYYEAILDMLGMANWQYLYTNVSFNDPVKEYLYDNIKESLNALQKALPDKNYQKYFDLLEARNS
ncbi:hypothetical protein [uncultured Dokdonia sp.]|uniref:hypothetical protein n=1 Tax=uncultured Dokdonia sp. TaxID=575653 RepID=UPI00260FA2DA|nr:hypothetical protein [uncultured Dokdonia sp.]